MSGTQQSYFQGVSKASNWGRSQVLDPFSNRSNIEGDFDILKSGCRASVRTYSITEHLQSILRTQGWKTLVFRCQLCHLEKNGIPVTMGPGKVGSSKSSESGSWNPPEGREHRGRTWLSLMEHQGYLYLRNAFFLLYICIPANIIQQVSIKNTWFGRASGQHPLKRMSLEHVHQSSSLKIHHLDL